MRAFNPVYFASLAIGIVLGTASFAVADTVTYTTQIKYEFGPFTGTNEIGLSNGTTVTLSAISNAVTLNDSPFSFGNLFQITTSGGDGTLAAAPGDFTLKIIESGPTAGSATIHAVFTGMIGSTQSTATVVFDSSSVTIGSEQYSLVSTTVPVAPPASGGLTTFQAMISPVPEPSSLGLLGLGFISVAGGALLRRKR
jgi:hypothetical protein